MSHRNDAMSQADFLERVQLVLQALRNGDLSPRVRPWDDPQSDKVGRSLNETLDHLARVISEVNRVNYEVGVMGQLGPITDVPEARGEWRHLLDLVNQTAGNITSQIRNFHSVLRAIEHAEFGQRVTVEAHGELRQLRDAINRVISKLDEPRSEIFRRGDGARGELIFPSE